MKTEQAVLWAWLVKLKLEWCIHISTTTVQTNNCWLCTHRSSNLLEKWEFSRRTIFNFPLFAFQSDSSKITKILYFCVSLFIKESLNWENKNKQNSLKFSKRKHFISTGKFSHLQCNYIPTASKYNTSCWSWALANM